MGVTPQYSAGSDEDGTPPPASEQHDLALEPNQAWFLKGVMGEADEVVIPGLLLDDLGGCTNVEAALDLATFHQMLAMAAMQDARMFAVRASGEHERDKPEANVWHVEGPRSRNRIDVRLIRALDRVVVDNYGTRCIETMRASAMIPGPRAWR
jgi:hypothetical protein